MTTSTHRHPKWGEGEILGWFDEDMVMFRSNHGKTMLREATLTPLEQSPLVSINPSPPTINPPELQPPQTFTPAPADEAPPEMVPSETVLADLAEAAVKNPRHRKKQPLPDSVSTKVDLNKVKAPAEISETFPRLGKIGAKKLFDKTPSSGWVSLNSVRDFCGDLFPTQESWEAFSQLFEVN
jgi:hypothetical protein